MLLESEAVEDSAGGAAVVLPVTSNTASLQINRCT